MVTVFKLCESHGCADRVTTSIVGNLMSHWFVSRNLHGRITSISDEPHGVFKVWAYPDECTELIEGFIAEANAKINAHLMGKNVTEINQVKAQIKSDTAREKARRPRIGRKNG